MTDPVEPDAFEAASARTTEIEAALWRAREAAVATRRAGRSLDRAIAEAFAAGATHQRIADAVGLSTRGVRLAAERYRATEDTPTEELPLPKGPNRA